ncbi:MAG: alpha/beta fold hydrolase [Methylacidiphilales bacterium]|nr:alpha/beta fold hydrolase [Candidatus Methylacidiphilales bacterium]
MPWKNLGLGLTLAAMFFLFPRLRAETPLHAQVLVFIPAYEGSALYDTTLFARDEDPPCVWGGVDAIRSAELYLSLRMPNPLAARPMLTAGPIDVYSKFVAGITAPQKSAPGFCPYTPGSDFFVFAYDWRQEIATVTAPLLAQALDSYARIHEEKTGIPAANTQFVLVAHSMGGLVARTFLGENPQWADRIAALYLVGTPNLGSVKAIKTLIVGPGGLKENAINFPASLLNLLPNNVDASLTKLVAVTRPSLYELLPFDDPRWECVDADGTRRRISAQDILRIGPWQPYWPSPELEQRVFLNDWLKKRQTEGRKQINVADWQFCQDPDLPALQKILAQVREWRLKMGSLAYTNTLLTRPGEPSRLRVIVGTGLKTPTGIITEGAHDFSLARYTYEPDNDGDETVTAASVLDDLHPAPDRIKRFTGITHGKLVTDRQFLDYFCGELAAGPVVRKHDIVRSDDSDDVPPVHLAPGSSVP